MSRPLFVQIKCELGQVANVADAIMDSMDQLGVPAHVWSTSGKFDLLVQFTLEEDQSIPDFINDKVHKIRGIRDTYTIIAFRIFGAVDSPETGITVLRPKPEKG
jgi:DNA-binding Lrp family transcriptional regulator